MFHLLSGISIYELRPKEISFKCAQLWFQSPKPSQSSKEALGGLKVLSFDPEPLEINHH